MPMPRSLQPAQVWNASGYICRDCRHKLLASSTRRARFHSTLTPFKENNAGDDWFSNFNDLSDASSKTKLKDGSQDIEKSSSGDVVEKKAKTRRERFPTQRSNVQFDILKASLSDRLAKGAIAGEPDGGHSKETSGGASVYDTRLSGRRLERDSPSLTPTQERNVRKRAKRKSNRRAQSAGTVSAEQTNGSTKNKTLDEIVKELQEEIRVRMPQYIQAATNKDKSAKSEAQPTTQSSSEPNSSTIDSALDEVPTSATVDPQVYRPFAGSVSTSSLDGIYERLERSPAAPFGMSSEQRALVNDTIRPIPEKPAPLKIPLFGSTASQIPSFRRSASGAGSKQPRSLIQRWKDSTDRPKWGGVVSKSDSAKEGDPGFLNSLSTVRATPSSTAKSSRTSSTSPFADSPADLAEIEATSAAKNHEIPGSANISRVVSAGSHGQSMVALRRGLAADLEKTKRKLSETSSNLPVEAESKAGSVVDNVKLSPASVQRESNMDGRIRKYASGLIRQFFGSGASPLKADFADETDAAKQSNVSSSASQVQQDLHNEDAPNVQQSDPASEALAKLHSLEADKQGRVSAVDNGHEVLLKKPSEKPKDNGKAPQPVQSGGRKTRRLRRISSEEKSTIRRIPSDSTVNANHRQSDLSGAGDAKNGDVASSAKSTETSAPQTSSTVMKAPKDENADEKQAAGGDAPSGGMVSSGDPAMASIDASDLSITPLDIPQPPVPGLQYGLDRVLFNSGVYQLQDPHSRVYNFDPYLQKIMPVVEFDYNALKEYKTSSQDTALSALAKEHGKRYIGSTSSMTGTLGHFHYLLSNFRPLNLSMFSRGFPVQRDDFTNINKAPNAIFLRWKGDDTYAIDADKEYDGANVLMMLGKSMEKLLTLPTAEYERYRKENSHSVTDEERNAPESYEYTTMGDFLMRSQLDAHDARLPGNGMFDLKTRAVVSIRMRSDDFEPMTGYQIHTLQGRWESYEREYHDMIRSTMLKYMLQARMGRMDGIFVAYHNVERIFGFQYIPLHEMDRALHGQAHRCLGDQEFKLSLEILNKVFDKATAKFPGQSLRFHFEAAEEQAGGKEMPVMWVYAEPMAEDDIESIQSLSKSKVAEFERTMMGIEKEKEDSSEKLVDKQIALEAEVVSDEPNDPAERIRPELAVISGDESAASDGDQSPTPNRGSDYSTTNTNADPSFVEAVQGSSRELMPLFVASVICQSRIDGSVVARPEKMKPEDKWEVEYLLQEYETNEASWARYADTKTKRKQVMERYRDEEEEEEASENGNGEKKKKAKTYIDFLKSMSQRGREFRGRMDDMEAGKAPVVIGRPLYSPKEALEEFEDVDQYMDWMYKRA